MIGSERLPKNRVYEHPERKYRMMPDIFISPDQLANQRTDVTVVDVRREGEYGGNHIPGGVHVPFERFRDPTDETEGKLPTGTEFASLLGEAGITSGDRIVAYDNDFGVYASRFLVTAEVFGHDIDRLHLLDGDIDTWSRSYETTATVPEPPVTDYTPGSQADSPLVSAAELESALDDDAIVVDTRDPIEYDAVHLPGAVNFQWQDLVDEETRQLKSREERERILAAHGMTLDRRVRLYCNTARRLSFVYAVLRDLGHENVGFYEGGINAWANDGGPVETTTPD